MNAARQPDRVPTLFAIVSNPVLDEHKIWILKDKGTGFEVDAMLLAVGPVFTKSHSNCTNFQIVAVLAAPGSYALHATNTDGQTSNIFTFTVTAAPGG